MIKGLAHVCMGSADLKATERFYCEALGLRRLFDFRSGGKLIGFYLEVGRGGYLEFFRQDRAASTENPAIRHFCIEVDGMDDTVRRIRSMGYEISDKKLGADGSWQAWTQDPDGVPIEFHEYTDQSSQRTGRHCDLG
jgi:catechol 2,3-dioxygenase-like lactoylglutathione lyase family enzyme